MSDNQLRVALVTGAGSGIGEAVSRALLGEGYCVVLAGRRAERLTQVAQGAEERTLVVPTDIGDPVAVHALFEATQARFGRLDLLFNNAGFGAPAVPIDELDPSDWRAVVDTNLSGTFYCIQQAFRLMKSQTPRGGRIINNGSISASAPRPFSAPYTSTKHAITGLTKSAALDGRAHDIACGQIDIGNAETETAARMKAGALQAHGETVVEPMMAVDNVVRALLYMASLPLDANCLFLTVLASKMPFVGRG